MSKKKPKILRDSPEGEGDEATQYISIFDGETLEPLLQSKFDKNLPHSDDESLEEYKQHFKDGGTEVQVLGEIIATGELYKEP